MIPKLLRLMLFALVAVGFAAVVLVVWLVMSLRADRPETYEDIAMHFKYRIDRQ